MVKRILRRSQNNFNARHTWRGKDKTMNIELKFRIWDEKAKVFFPIEFGTSRLEGMSSQEINKQVEQYTGLKDKNGTEIYEGDFLRFIGKILTPVTFQDAEYIAGQFALSPQAPRSDEVFEVIGNIHENPELLIAA